MNSSKSLMLCVLSALVLMTQQAVAMGPEPVLSKWMLDKLEAREAAGQDPVAVEAQAWIGKSLNRLWLKADLELHEGVVEEAQYQVLYSRAVAPYWDLQWGLAQDVRPESDATWMVLGIQGVAPYFFEADLALFFGESGDFMATLELEYEWMLTQRWVLIPEMEVSFQGQNRPEQDLGAGLAEVEAGLRLGYHWRREVMPYVGISWHHSFGETADLIQQSGSEPHSSAVVVGLKLWF